MSSEQWNAVQVEMSRVESARKSVIWQATVCSIPNLSNTSGTCFPGMISTSTFTGQRTGRSSEQPSWITLPNVPSNVPSCQDSPWIRSRAQNPQVNGYPKMITQQYSRVSRHSLTIISLEICLLVWDRSHRSQRRRMQRERKRGRRGNVQGEKEEEKEGPDQ